MFIIFHENLIFYLQQIDNLQDKTTPILIENGEIRFLGHNGGNKGSRRRRILAAEATGQGQGRGTLNGHLRIKDCWVWKSE